jgi:hypothetical protein
LSSSVSAEAAVPERVWMLFQLMPGLQRWSGKRLSSPTTLRTARARAATASASSARQSTTQSAALDSRASP